MYHHHHHLHIITTETGVVTTSATAATQGQGGQDDVNKVDLFIASSTTRRPLFLYTRPTTRWMAEVRLW